MVTESFLSMSSHTVIVTVSFFETLGVSCMLMLMCFISSSLNSCYILRVLILADMVCCDSFHSDFVTITVIYLVRNNNMNSLNMHDKIPPKVDVKPELPLYGIYTYSPKISYPCKNELILLKKPSYMDY